MLRISNVSVRIISWSNPPKPRFTSGEGGVRHQFISVPPYGGTYHQLSKVLCYSVVTDSVSSLNVRALFTSDKGGGKCFCLCLSVCLLARLLKNTCMDLDEMLHVDKTDVWTWTN